MAVRFPMCFLTFSKKARSSWAETVSGAGASGSGMTGVNVGSTKVLSVVFGLCDSLARLADGAGGGSVALKADVGAWSGPLGAGGAAAAFSGRRFLLSLLALAGGAKLPTGGILGPSRPTWPGCGVGVATAAGMFSSGRGPTVRVCAADSGRNCLKSSRRSGAEWKRLVTCAYTSWIGFCSRWYVWRISRNCL